jgi:CRISPR-associated protein Csm3
MKIIKLTGTLEVLTGLHIGGGDDTMKIGGIDNQVIKDPNTGHPYVPGSSIKGKMRSLLEWHLGFVGISQGEPLKPQYLLDPIFDDEEKLQNAITLLKLFGATITKKDEEALQKRNIDTNHYIGISRLSVGDAHLSDEASKKHKEGKLQLFEAKYENVINRCRARANPRQTERVPAGVTFDLDIRIKVLHNDDEKEFLKMIEKGIELIESDYLGGNGSRGYGRVKFHVNETNG